MAEKQTYDSMLMLMQMILGITSPTPMHPDPMLNANHIYSPNHMYRSRARERRMDCISLLRRNKQLQHLERTSRYIGFYTRLQHQIVFRKVEAREAEEVFLRSAADGGEFLLHIDIVVEFRDDVVQ